jgi:hypothetical protein
MTLLDDAAVDREAVIACTLVKNFRTLQCMDVVTVAIKNNTASVIDVPRCNSIQARGLGSVQAVAGSQGCPAAH